MRVMRVLFCGIIYLMLGATSPGLAGAWNQKQGKGEVIHSINYYNTSSFTDENGDRQSQETYHKVEDSLYVEYGLNEAITLGITPRLQYVWQDQPFTRTFGSGPGKITVTGTTAESNFNLADTDFFARFRLWHDEASTFAIQPLVKLPGLYDENDTLPLGQGQVDIELRALFGHNFYQQGLDLFSTYELAYRHRLDDPNDEIRFAQALGWNATQNWLLLGELFGTFSLGDESPNLFDPGNPADYDLVKWQLSAVYQISDNYRIQFGGFQHIYARNTGNGGGVLVALWHNF